MGVVWEYSIRILKCQKGVVCVVCVGGLALNLVSLLAVSIPSMLECVPDLLDVKGCVCCDSCKYITCMSSLFRWL